MTQLKFVLIPLLPLLILAGCQSAMQPLAPVKIITETVELEIYQPTLPQAMLLDDVTWYVLTEDVLAEKIAEIESFSGNDFVVFAITPQGYENMAYNFQEMRRYILQQNEIIKYYVEATKPKNIEEWAALNEAKLREQLNAAGISNSLPPVLEEQEPGFFSRLWPF